MKKLNFIKADVIFEGNGCVNWDCTEQKYQLKALGLLDGNNCNDNLKFAKKTFIRDDEGNESFRYKVSTDCIKNAAFKTVSRFNPSSLVANTYLRASAFAMPDFILHGWMSTKANSASLKRKSPICLTCAEEVTDDLKKAPGRKKCYLEVHSSAYGKEYTEEDDKKSTSLHYSENVGQMKYRATMYIDLEELAFISADKRYDRMAIDLDDNDFKAIFMKYLSCNMKDFTLEADYYYREGTIESDATAEYGILLNGASVDMLAKRMFKNIENVCIRRSNAFFRFSEFRNITLYGTDEYGETTEEEISYADLKSTDIVPSFIYKKADPEQHAKNAEEYKRWQDEMKKEAKINGKKSKKSKEDEEE